MSQPTSPRICGLDLIRVVAIFFVIAGHFFSLHTSYRTAPFDNFSMFFQGQMAELFTGVPLFYMLTGYLNANKKVCWKYYKGMFRILFSYLFFSIITILFRNYYLGESLGTFQWIMKIFDYTAIPYAWFIEMWIGLALLTPFLNYLYRAIETKKEKLIGILTLSFLTALPYLLNRYGMHLAPGYWYDAAFPLLFFFLGAYIREYQPKINKNKLLCVMLLCVSITPLFNILFFKGHDVIDITGGSRGFFSTCVTVSIFMLLYKVDISNIQINRWVSHCSKVSYEMYLCCYMFDMLYYPWFKDRFFETQTQFFPWFFVIVPLIFMSSYIVASVYRVIAGRLRMV